VFATQPSSWTGQDAAIKEWHWMLWRNGTTYREEFMEQALESLNEITRELAVQHNIVVYDAAKTMPKSTEAFYDDVHFNVAGARRFATELAGVLSQTLQPELYNKTEPAIVAGRNES
jgi:hypothetical protein